MKIITNRKVDISGTTDALTSTNWTFNCENGFALSILNHVLRRTFAAPTDTCNNGVLGTFAAIPTTDPDDIS